jgi:hypothetical protein
VDAVVWPFGISPEDFEQAKAIATHVVRLWGQGGAEEQRKVTELGIWGDHPAVQAAVEAIKWCRTGSWGD